MKSIKSHRVCDDVLAPIRQHLPSSASDLSPYRRRRGHGNFALASLWHKADRAPDRNRRFPTPQFEWAAVKNAVLGADAPALAQWLKQTGGVLAAQETITELVSIGPETVELGALPASANQPAAMNNRLPSGADHSLASFNSQTLNAKGRDQVKTVSGNVAGQGSPNCRTGPASRPRTLRRRPAGESLIGKIVDQQRLAGISRGMTQRQMIIPGGDFVRIPADGLRVRQRRAAISDALR